MNGWDRARPTPRTPLVRLARLALEYILIWAGVLAALAAAFASTGLVPP